MTARGHPKGRCGAVRDSCLCPFPPVTLLVGSLSLVERFAIYSTPVYGRFPPQAVIGPAFTPG